ncbi:hypothetical protein H2248_010865 [Termitomyces sp. 'cryptogamus']|nr:hypothetical protein H2248_010865 [Termitomyces sp. 'cryptogamus']
MAFPIPAHLPRRSAPQDVTTQILSKLDAATNKTLNAELARSWVSELDETITLTKTRLHERIQEDLPEFQRQLAASKDVQERLRALTANVDTLSNSVSNPETGLIPSLVRTLTEHAELTEQTTEARVEHEALSHLLACRTSLKSFENLVKDGKLSEAVGVCREVETLLQSTPTYLDETRVMVDIRRKFRSTQARNDEQLSDAYSRSVFVSQHKIEPSSHELTIHASVQVRQSDATIHLPAVMTSLSSNSLSNHLTILRRDLTSLFIDILSRQPVLITVSSEASRHNLVLNPARSKDETLITRLENLSGFFNFLSSHFFPSLPASQSAPFTRALCKPTTTSVLNNLLIPSLPSSFDLLPPFLELTRQAVAFEDRIIIGLLGNDPNDHPIKSWVEGVSGHYERQRRMDILSRSREIIVTPDDQYDTFLVEVEADVAPMAEPSVVPVQDDAWGFDNDMDSKPDKVVVNTTDEEISPVKDDAWGFDDDNDSKPDPVVVDTFKEEISPVKDDAWGFDDDITDAGADETVDENSWGFDDDIPAEPEPKSVTPDVTKEAPPPKVTNGDVEQEPDPSETWGWNEGEDVPLAEESAWDDPWADPPAASTPDSAADSRPPPAPSITSPKVAGGLQKAANKGKKKHLDGNSSTSSPVITSPQPSVSTTSSPPLNKPSSTKSNGHPPLRSATTRPSTIDLQPPLKETYLASGRSKLIIRQVEDVLAEGKHLASSSIFPASSSTQTSTAVGTTLLLTAPAVLDLHRALYPVKFSKAFQSPEAGMRYANDCAFLAGEVERMKRGSTTLIAERLGECAGCLKVLSESWYSDVITREQKALDKILKAGAQGFTYTGDQDRYDECESAMTQVLKEVRRLASRLKGILTKTKYYTAIGLFVEAVLDRTIRDILALPDIPEVESHRLSELCHIFNALEGLFVEDATQSSFVVAYVPSWLKFSYLTELLEASMADITYLFEEGALVDFQVDELVRLVRALFADTQLRTNTITKLTGGHPAPRGQ